MGTAGTQRRWAALSRWSLARQGLRVVLGVLALGWTAFTVGWIRIGHPLNAAVTTLIALCDLVWVVRTGHPAAGPEADDAWSRKAVPVGVVVMVFSLAALTPSRSSSPPGAVVALSAVLWACVLIAVWLTGTPARSTSVRTRRRRPGPA